RVGRLRVIFTLPSTLTGIAQDHPAPLHWPRDPLAYVEWFAPFHNSPAGAQRMFLVNKMRASSDRRTCGAIVPLANIRQSCMLFPVYGQLADLPSQQSWTSENVLDECSSFLLNNWRSLYSYQTLW
ncbi:hypothetical protein EV121DRAFT_218562, partial [Schizophyllum commune]